MHTPALRFLGLPLAVLLALAGCTAGTPGEEESPDGIDAPGLSAGKADGTSYTACELDKTLDFVNALETSYDVLRAAGVHSTASRNIIKHRDGLDGQPGTGDDDAFDDIEELDAVPYVGPVAFRQLVTSVTDLCVAPPAGTSEVIFSPQPYESSHLVRTAAMIDTAERSIDIAMYSFSDARIMDALKRAVARGVSIRMIYDPAGVERTSPVGTQSGRVEEAGIDVRYVNKIMHHKFTIIDGPRDEASQAASATLITGSGNWSNGAGTRYDENTVFLRETPELVLRFQREFNLLWKYSRDFVLATPFTYFESSEITDDMIATVDDPNVDAAYTSANFRASVSSTYGGTFSVITGSNALSDRLVELIRGARRSIWIASGHLRSRPVAEALMAAHDANPDLDIRVYLDDQEYLSEYANRAQESDLASCLAAATTDSARQTCYDKGFLFSYVVTRAGISLRYKFYAYRWDFSYADQMHHKYFIIDGETLASGSYNLSDNAEHQTMENMVFYRADAYPDLVRAFEDNFRAIWETGTAEGRWDTLMSQVEAPTGDFPIVFPPMALTWDQVTELKSAMRAACPAIDSDAYRTDPPAHRYCDR